MKKQINSNKYRVIFKPWGTQLPICNQGTESLWNMREAKARSYRERNARHRANQIAKRDFFFLSVALGIVAALAAFILINL